MERRSHPLPASTGPAFGGPARGLESSGPRSQPEDARCTAPPGIPRSSHRPRLADGGSGPPSPPAFGCLQSASRLFDHPPPCSLPLPLPLPIGPRSHPGPGPGPRPARPDGGMPGPPGGRGGSEIPPLLTTAATVSATRSNEQSQHRPAVPSVKQNKTPPDTHGGACVARPYIVQATPTEGAKQGWKMPPYLAVHAALPLGGGRS